MKINEVEALLDLSRANVRFYEKEGLISPERKSNGYRDYSEEDIARLKRIIVFRKLGISVRDIKEIFDGTLTLQEAADNSVESIKEQIEELNGALKVCQMISQNDERIETFNEDHYLEVIENREHDGEKFIDFCKDYAQFELEVLGNMWKWVFFHNFDKDAKKHGVVYAVVIVLLICTVRGLMAQFVWKKESFIEAFMYPFIIFVMVSLILLPIFLLIKFKKEKAASVLYTIIFVIACIILALIAGLLVFGLLAGLVGFIKGVVAG
ncbi:MAG: MerR family transcriptional regulator [Faecalibacterium sp.]|nr:MerR family transcriptional regulator [Ruminococcus sp.]MCM1391968.1 MerR family transcriptional regulator [Ruminococcus sp.]MCM1485073.1 MerR family transcriptional regulator [Faecalibacterium sp.]